MEKDIFTKQWIIEHSIEICSRYAFGVLTLRSLHYQLVGIGMTNDINHYKRVVTAMIDARWNNDIDFDQFSDLDRVMIGETKFKQTNVNEAILDAEDAIKSWMQYYSKNRWENQEYYPEVFIEKKALQGVFNPVTTRQGVTLGACKGYPSLTFLHEASKRFENAVEEGKKPIIIYFGDYDPSGEDIPRSIYENFMKFGVEVEVRRIALMEDQVIEWNLPPAPAKESDVRTAKWTGLGQVELDAIKPEQLQQMCTDAINSIFDQGRFTELLIQEREETKEYRSSLKKIVQNINTDE
jgi:hypothetical protein